MESEQFDRIARCLAPAVTRRRALLALAGLGLGGAGEISARKKHKRHRRRRRRPDANPCQGRADGSACGDGRECSGEVCAIPPSCAGNASCIVDGNCCSGSCLEEWFACDPSGADQPCLRSGDCHSGMACVGFVCVTSPATP